MSTRILRFLVALTFALALSAGTANAHHGKPTVIVFTVQSIGFTTCPDSDSDPDSEPDFGLSFPMTSPGGSLLGQGVSCLRSFEGCQFQAGCRNTIHATFTLDFGRGSLTAPVVLDERWLTDTTVLQLTSGAISSGTGDFAGADGSILCAGIVRFTETDLIPRIVCVVRLN